MPNYLENLLYNISEINSKYREIDRISGNRFNIFSILKMETREVKLHSAIIAELLNPLGMHDMRTAFLDLFISQLRNLNNIKSLNFSSSLKTCVKIEMPIGAKTQTNGGRIDIVLIDENGNHIIIENKIHIEDQENQLIRYHNLKTKEKCLLYLTLFGDEPTDKSCGNLVKNTDYHCISYREMIINWLSECHKTSISHPKLRETILQYIITIKHLTGTSMSNFEERLSIYKAVGDKTENALAANELIKNWIHIKWHTEWDFWEELYSSLNNRISLSFKKDYDKERLSGAIHNKKNKNPWYGIFTFIKEIGFKGQTFELYFSIQRGFENLYYGINILEKGKPETEENYRNFRLKDESNLFFKESETALDDKFWAYKKITKINFHSFENEETIKLINPSFRAETINVLIEEFLQYIHEFNNDELIISEKVLI